MTEHDAAPRKPVDLGKQALAAFDPRDPLYRRKLWVRLTTPGTEYHHVFWGRIAAMLGLLAVVAWLGLAAATWSFVKYARGHTEVRFLDLALYPMRHDAYRSGLGHHYTRMGRVAFERQDYREGYALLQAGLARNPADLPARRAVAIAEVRFGRPDRALRTLTAGLPHARHDLPYLKLVFGLLQETQEDARTIALAAEYLPARPDHNLAHQFIALQAATAHAHRGRFAQAERLVAEWALERSLEGQLLLARCDWERGLRDQALHRLERQIPLFPHRDELYVELVRLHREQGNRGEARRVALLRQFNSPASPGPRVDLLHGYHASGDAAGETRELENYLATFGHDADALLLLLGYAVDTRQPALAERVVAHATEHEFPTQPFLLPHLHLRVATRDFAGAVALADAALREGRSDLDRTGGLVGALRAIALFGLGDDTEAHVALRAFLATAHVRASDALLLARQFAAMQRPLQARSVLERAIQVDPLSQPVLAALVQLDARLGNRAELARNLPALLALRHPSRSVLEALLPHLDRPADAPLREQIRAVLALSAPADPS